MRVIDTHLHMWDEEVLAYSWLEGPLARRFGGEEVARAHPLPTGRASAVFVQAETIERDQLAEVRWVESQAEAAGIVGIVAGAALHRGDATTAHLDALSAHRLVVGVRHNLQGEADGFAATSAFVSGARDVASRGWTFDACVRSAQMPDVALLAAAVPDLRIVLDHLGKPEVGTAGNPSAPTDAWCADLAALAAHPGVRGKLSGLPAEAGGEWTASQMTPFLDAAAEAFGVDRLMWGSDWPVSAIGPADGGAVAYQASARRRWLDAVVGWAEERGHDVDAILWSNARRFYRLDEV